MWKSNIEDKPLNKQKPDVRARLTRIDSKVVIRTISLQT